jgi:hypothetical protein
VGWIPSRRARADEPAGPPPAPAPVTAERVCRAPAPATAAAPKRFAVVIGSNVGTGSGQQPLSYADDDALGAYDLLTEAGFATTLLTDLDEDTRRRVGNRYDFARPATTWDFKRAIDDVIKERRAAKEPGEVRLLVWISAHGGPDGSLYFSNGRYQRLALAQDLFAATEREGIDVDLVLDSCWPRAVVGRDAGHAALERAHARASWAADLERYPRVGVLLAQTGDGKALEWSDLAAGIFSFLVRSGLRGAADIDGDGRVTYTEIEAFAQTASNAVDDARARLKVRAFLPRESMDRVLFDWSAPPRPGVRLRIPSDQELRLRIRRRETGILLETNKGREDDRCLAILLHLPPGYGWFEVAQLKPTGEIRRYYRIDSRVDRDLELADLVPDGPPVEARGEEAREEALRMGLFHDVFDHNGYRNWVRIRSSAWDHADAEALLATAAEHTRRRTWGWALIGGAALALAGGTAAYAVADATDRDWAAAVARGDAAASDRLGSRTHRYDILATVGLGLAGALGLTGAGLLVWDATTDDGGGALPEPSRVSLSIGPGGLLCSGRF